MSSMTVTPTTPAAFVARRINTQLVVTCTQVDHKIILRFVNGQRIEYELANFEAALKFSAAFEESVNRGPHCISITALRVCARGNDLEVS